MKGAFAFPVSWVDLVPGAAEPCERPEPALNPNHHHTGPWISVSISVRIPLKACASWVCSVNPHPYKWSHGLAFVDFVRLRSLGEPVAEQVRYQWTRTMVRRAKRCLQHETWTNPYATSLLLFRMRMKDWPGRIGNGLNSLQQRTGKHRSNLGGLKYTYYALVGVYSRIIGDFLHVVHVFEQKTFPVLTFCSVSPESESSASSSPYGLHACVALSVPGGGSDFYLGFDRRCPGGA